MKVPLWPPGGRAPSSVGVSSSSFILVLVLLLCGGLPALGYLAYTMMQNSAGKFVAPNTKTFAAAAGTADWAHAKDFNLVMTNAPGASSYPITASTFVLMHKQPKNAAASSSARKFFNWALTKGQPQASSLDYVPLPNPLVKRIQTYVGSSIR